MSSTALPPWRAWIIAARPKTLPAAIAPVVVGSALAYADGRFAPLPAIAALAAALLIQVGTNYANDYYDHLRGVDASDRQGPLRVAQSGLIRPEQLWVGTLLVFALAAVDGLSLVLAAGWPVLAIGVASIVAAFAYSAGPYPLSAHGLGDLFVFVFFGLVAVAGTYYVQALRLEPRVLVAAIPVGALTTAILVVNNLRDIASDRRAGRRTLAILLGPAATRLEYVLLLAAAYAIPALLWLARPRSIVVLLPWLSLPLALGMVRALYRARGGPEFNLLLAATGRLALIFSVLFALGLVV